MSLPITPTDLQKPGVLRSQRREWVVERTGWVLMALLLASFGNEPSAEFMGIGGTDFYVPSYLGAAIAVMGLIGVPTHLASYRRDGTPDYVGARPDGRPFAYAAAGAFVATISAVSADGIPARWRTAAWQRRTVQTCAGCRPVLDDRTGRR